MPWNETKALQAPSYRTVRTRDYGLWILTNNTFSLFFFFFFQLLFQRKINNIFMRCISCVFGWLCGKFNFDHFLLLCFGQNWIMFAKHDLLQIFIPLKWINNNVYRNSKLFPEPFLACKLYIVHWTFLFFPSMCSFPLIKHSEFRWTWTIKHWILLKYFLVTEVINWCTSNPWYAVS